MIDLNFYSDVNDSLMIDLNFYSAANDSLNYSNDPGGSDCRSDVWLYDWNLARLCCYLILTPVF